MPRRLFHPPYACALLLALAVPVHAQAPSTTVERDGEAIVFKGRIEGASAAKFRELLREPGVSRLVITSGGGLVDAALDMAEAVADHGLDVEVPQACLSSCANYVLPAGRKKRLGHARAVGWHGNMAHVLHLEQTGQARWSEQQMEEARRLARREQAFFQRIGVDGFVCWFGKIAPHHVDEFYALSPQDMARFGIAGVTVSDGDAPAGAPEPLTIDWTLMEAAPRPALPLGPP